MTSQPADRGKTAEALPVLMIILLVRFLLVDRLVSGGGEDLIHFDFIRLISLTLNR